MTIVTGIIMAQPLINITAKRAYLFAVFLVLYEFLTYIANDMIMPGMIKVAASFHGPESAIASSLTAYVLGGASLQIFLGPLSDRYGRRPVMIWGVFLFFLCTVFIACSLSIHQFLVARFFQGMGLCFICVIGYATLQEIFAEMDAIRLISVMANVSITAPLLGPLLGAVFIHYFNWRIIFVIIAVFALLALWGLWRFMPEPLGQIKRNGEQIKVMPLSLRVIAANYKALVLNKSFMAGSLAMGLLALPCVAWIGLAPVMLVLDAKLSLIQYGLWQIPVFGAYAMGNICLHRMTHHASLVKLIWIGSVIAVTGLLGMVGLPMLAGSNYLWLMPGLILYFWGSGMAMAPLNRFILFSTQVSKGTASASVSLIIMSIQGLGIEVFNVLYLSHDNLVFGLACAVVGIVYMVLWSGASVYSRSG
jgi:DHA1 family multidrug/chloramphenicol efflux transport protein-like MFS transporter